MTKTINKPQINQETQILDYCLYARKSSEEEERQARSIDSQISEMTAKAEYIGINIKDVYTESHSVKASGKRPVYNQMIEDIKQGKFNGIITWAPDRLARNAGDLGAVVDLMDKGLLIEIRTHEQVFTNNPNDKFLLMILGSQAKLENDHRGINVKRGLRAKCEGGRRPGRSPLGYKLIRSEHFGKPSAITIDEERAPYIKKMFEYVIKNGYSGRQVHKYLTDEGFVTKKGKILTLSMIYRIFKEPFYYGEFEYPRGSDNWYKGTHTPLITKEAYELANKKLKTYEKSKWGSKTFHFSRIFKCGHCGSGISGEERINRHGKKYIYYKCNKHGGNTDCRTKYIREEKLIESIARIVDNIKENDINLNKKIQKEVSKFNDLKNLTQTSKNTKELTTHEYIKYLLKSGTNIERRNVLNSIKGQLLLIKGEIEVR